MDTIDVINELCVSIDADMCEQRRGAQRRLQFPLEPEWALALRRCPDWPFDRVRLYAETRERWYAADVAEDAFADKIPIGDAVWLLLQAGALPDNKLMPFAVSCAEFAVAYATGEPAKTWNGDSWVFLARHFPWIARELESRDSERAWRVHRAGRAAGIVAGLLAGGPFSSRAGGPFSVQKAAMRIAHLANTNGPQGPHPELLRQLKHIHALVT